MLVRSERQQHLLASSSCVAQGCFSSSLQAWRRLWREGMGPDMRGVRQNTSLCCGDGDSISKGHGKPREEQQLHMHQERERAGQKQGICFLLGCFLLHDLSIWLQQPCSALKGYQMCPGWGGAEGGALE